MLFKEVARSWLKGQPRGLRGMVTFPMSFESGEAGAYKVYFPFPVTITKIRSSVTKALAATDAGTLTGANSTGNSAGGVASHAASAAIGDAKSVTPTTNVVVAKDDYYQVTSAKTTAGGKVMVTLEYLTN